MTCTHDDIVYQQRIIIRDLNIAEDMIARHEKSTNGNIYRFASAWRDVKAALIKDYERITKQVTWPRAR